MKNQNHMLLKLSQFIIMNFLVMFFLSASALSQGTYEFDRMWPTLQQPWYFDDPTDAAIDKDGFVYITDTANNRILKFTADGHFVANWGNGGGLFAPFGIAADTLGFVYVTDVSSSYVQKFDSDGQFISRWQCKDEKGRNLNPHAISIDYEGYVYLTDFEHGSIHKFTTEGQRITWKHEDIEEQFFDDPTGISVDNKGFAYVTDRTEHRVHKFTTDGQSVEWGSSDIAEAGRFNEPMGITADDHFIYVVDRINDRIQKFTRNGEFEDKWGSEGEGDEQFYAPSGITLSPKGLLYVVDTNNGGIQKFTSEGKFLARWGSYSKEDGQFSRPMGIAVHNNFIYVADSHNHRIQKFEKISTHGNRFSVQFVKKWGTKGSEEGQFQSPRGIAVDSSGNVYVADKLNNRIQKFDPDGTALQWEHPDIQEAHLDKPCDVAIDENGLIYVADTGNDMIRLFQSDGSANGAWGDSSQFFSPSGIAFHNGWLYVTDTYNDRIQRSEKIEDQFETWEQFSNGEFLNPTGIAVDNEGYVYVADTFSNRIQQFSPEGELVSIIGEVGQGVGQLKNPNYLCIDTDSNVYVSDNANNRVQVYKPDEPTASVSRAVIVAGGGAYPGNHLWDATRMCASFAYRALNYQGFNKKWNNEDRERGLGGSGNNIYYLTSDAELDLNSDGIADRYGDATITNLESAFSEIAEKDDTKDLIIYLVDHGGKNKFRMNETETLSTDDLGRWLDMAQASVSDRMIMIYDGCNSGTFQTLHQPGEEKHIVITSTSEDEKAYFIAQGTVSFSNFFWSAIFNGDDVRTAFSLAQNAMGKAAGFEQNPAIFPSDTILTHSIYIGRGVEMNWAGPVIYDVPSNYTVDPETSSARLYAYVNVGQGYETDHVWATIIPPEYGGTLTDNSVIELPTIDLTPKGNELYEGTYDKFGNEGSYHVIIHARDNKGNTSSIESPIEVSGSSISRNRAIIFSGGSAPYSVRHAELAKNVLKSKNYTSEDGILSMISPTHSPDDLKSAIENFSSLPDIQELLVYLVGEGQQACFQMDDTGRLSADDLALWFDEFQKKTSARVILVYDADYSGSFLPALKLKGDEEGRERILVTSSSGDQAAFFSSEGMISFSTFFWINVSNGFTIRDAFFNAKHAIDIFPEGRGIVPQLVDDKYLAMNHVIGTEVRLAENSPIIGSVSPGVILKNEGDTSATIWAAVSDTTTHPPEAWAIITLPDGSGQKTIQLKDDDGDGQYLNAYDGFSDFGTYHIAVYAKDAENHRMSLYQKTFVYQSFGADSYEEGQGDDSFGHATLAIVDSEIPQHHNFYGDDHVDWVRFYGVDSEFYSIEVSPHIIGEENLGANCDLTIQLYDSEENPVKDEYGESVEKDENGNGEREIIEWKCSEGKAGYYYLRIGNKDSAAATSYNLKIYTPTADFQGRLRGRITDFYSKNPISGAQILTDIENTTFHYESESNSNGEYIFSSHKPGKNVKITIRATGYEEITRNDVSVIEGILLPESENFELKRILHTADTDRDDVISISELLRVQQLYSVRSYHCDPNGEDGYTPGFRENQTCQPHNADYSPQDWVISMQEFLRVVQFYNLEGYHVDIEGEDGFRPGKL